MSSRHRNGVPSTRDRRVVMHKKLRRAVIFVIKQFKLINKALDITTKEQVEMMTNAQILAHPIMGPCFLRGMADHEADLNRRNMFPPGPLIPDVRAPELSVSGGLGATALENPRSQLDSFYIDLMHARQSAIQLSHSSWRHNSFGQLSTSSAMPGPSWQLDAFEPMPGPSGVGKMKRLGMRE